MDYSKYTVKTLTDILTKAIVDENFELAIEIRDVINSRGGIDNFMDFETQMQIIFEHMDFDKVYNVMDFLNWGYKSNKNAPTIDELKKMAKNLLTSIWNMEEGHERVATECGGFRAERYVYDGLKILKLSFILTSWELDYEVVTMSYDKYMGND
jgi:hypothetical protein